MPNVNDADRQRLNDAAHLPGAMYGARIYTMTALLALAQQREAFERELELLRTEHRGGQGGIGTLLGYLVAQRKGAVALLIGLLAVAMLLLVPFRRPQIPPLSAPTSTHRASPTLPKASRIASALPDPRAAATPAPAAATGPASRSQALRLPSAAADHPTATARVPPREDTAPALPPQQQAEVALASSTPRAGHPSAPAAATFATMQPLAPPSASFRQDQARQKREREEAIDAIRALRGR